MGIFFRKKLSCGCKIVACQTKEEKNVIFITGHSYGWICDKCVNLPEKIIDERLENMKKNDYKIYLSLVNGWYRSPSSPTDYSEIIDIHSFSYEKN